MTTLMLTMSNRKARKPRGCLSATAQGSSGLRSSRKKEFGKKNYTSRKIGNAALQKSVAGCSVTIDTHGKNHPTTTVKSSKRISNAGMKFPISSPLSCREQNQQRSSSSSRANSALARGVEPCPSGQSWGTGGDSPGFVSTASNCGGFGVVHLFKI